MVQIKIDFDRAEIMEPLTFLKTYVKQMNKALGNTAKTKRKNLRKNKNKIIEDFSTLEKGMDYYKMIKKTREHTISKQNRYQNYSFIMVINSILENIFKEMCQAIEKRKDISYNFERVNKNYSPYEQAKYFFKENNLCFFKDKEANFYKNFKKIRNCIVHCSGVISHSKDYCHIKNQIIKNDDNVKLIKDRWKLKKLDVNIDYCKKCLKCFIDIFDRLFENLGFGPREIKID